ncbi:hypothetical protein P5V15_002583 [Pogonomyrmex californicus]
MSTGSGCRCGGGLGCAVRKALMGTVGEEGQEMYMGTVSVTSCCDIWSQNCLLRFKFAWDKESARRWMGGTARKLTDEVKEFFYVEILRSTLPFKFGRGAGREAY